MLHYLAQCQFYFSPGCCTISLSVSSISYRDVALSRWVSVLFLTGMLHYLAECQFYFLPGCCTISLSVSSISHRDVALSRWVSVLFLTGMLHYLAECQFYFSPGCCTISLSVSSISYRDVVLSRWVLVPRCSWLVSGVPLSCRWCWIRSIHRLSPTAYQQCQISDHKQLRIYKVIEVSTT